MAILIEISRDLLYKHRSKVDELVMDDFYSVAIRIESFFVARDVGSRKKNHYFVVVLYIKD